MAFRKSSISVLVVSLFATLLVFSPSGLAQDLTPGFGFNPPPSLPPLEQCWLSIEEIGGCYSEVYTAFLNGTIGTTIGPACCLAIKDITTDCWLHMFPNAPTFPSLLDNYCKRYQVGPPTSSNEPDN
ncbi:egg cell-secreted protein 1.2-like [Cynara cardunculus var. scolymus]|uniref:egg cell-secreted protein 1.2-like n=1 Tax=Cynara cardunculus var. scolymus TaxID=59895 RepID=UPI000D62D4EE|nr:egg cell-secreted protein 1.2-like [Cynara cardunculus var. scolymus]